MVRQALCIIAQWYGEFKLELQPGNAQFGSKSVIFSPVRHWNSTDDPKKNRAPLLCYIKLWVPFRCYWSIQTGVTVRKHSIWVKTCNSLSRVTLKYDGWPWKTIGHLFYATLSFVHHFIAIVEFKLGLQSRNAQIGQNWRFLSRVTLKFDGWSWKTIGLLSYATSSLEHQFITICEFKLKLRSGNG